MNYNEVTNMVPKYPVKSCVYTVCNGRIIKLDVIGYAHYCNEAFVKLFGTQDFVDWYYWINGYVNEEDPNLFKTEEEAETYILNGNNGYHLKTEDV